MNISKLKNLSRSGLLIVPFAVAGFVQVDVPFFEEPRSLATMSMELSEARPLSDRAPASEDKKIEGEWKTYKKDSSWRAVQRDLKKHEELADKWNLASKRNIKNKLEYNSLHIFYSKDVLGNATVPRILITETVDDPDGNGVNHVQGTEGYFGEVEREILNAGILIEKFETLNSTDSYLYGTAVDMKRVYELQQKSLAREVLSQEDLQFLYNDDEINTIGLSDSNKKFVREVLMLRNVSVDRPFVNGEITAEEYKEVFTQSVLDMETLDLIEEKSRLKVTLSMDELRFLYKTDRQVYGVGRDVPKRFKEIIKGRQRQVDRDYIYGIIAQDEYEKVMAENRKIHALLDGLHKKSESGAIATLEELAVLYRVDPITSSRDSAGDDKAGKIVKLRDPKVDYARLFDSEYASEIESISCRRVECAGLVIPEGIDELTIRASDDIYKGGDKLSIASIPDSLKKLKIHFDGNLADLKLPAEHGAEITMEYKDFENVSNGVIPEGIHHLETYDIEDMSGHEFPSSLQTANFKRMKEFKGLAVPEGVEVSVDFRRLLAEGSVIPEGVVGLSAWAKPGLSALTLPSTLKDLEFNTVENQDQLVIPEGVVSARIGLGSFEGKPTLPDSLKELSYSTNGLVKDASNAVIPEGVTSLDFLHISRMNNVQLPSSLVEFDVPSLREDSIEGLVLPEGLKTLRIPVDVAPLIKIPDSVETLRLSGYGDGKGITLPKSLKVLSVSTGKVETELEIPQGVKVYGHSGY